MEELGSRARYWFQTDGLDSIIALTDERGTIVSPLLYDEYGNQLAGSTALHLFGHTAQPHDPETGLQHFYARYYDPATGVWLTQDPYRGRLDIPVTLHRYGYVGANPMTWVDAWGYAINLAAGIAGIVGGAIIGGAVSAVSQAAEGEIDWRIVGVNAVGGAAVGGVCGVSLGLGCVAAGAAVGAATQVAEDAIKGEEITWQKTATSAVISGVLAPVGGRVNSSIQRHVIRNVGGRPAAKLATKLWGKNAMREYGRELASMHVMFPYEWLVNTMKEQLPWFEDESKNSASDKHSEEQRKVQDSVVQSSPMQRKMSY
jgi:RHS repeat-associated protein